MYIYYMWPSSAADDVRLSPSVCNRGVSLIVNAHSIDGSAQVCAVLAHSFTVVIIIYEMLMIWAVCYTI